MSNNINYYIGLITSQYQNSPKFLNMVNSVLQKETDSTNVLDLFDESFDIDKAIGKQLDILGIIIGRSRIIDIKGKKIDDIQDIDSIQNWDTFDAPSGILNDDDYRFLLKAKIILNNWDGITQTLYEKWNILFPSKNILIIDNQNMTMDIILVGSFTEMQKQMILNGFIIPKPCGVMINYFIGYFPIFGFGLDNEYISGFGKGKWLGVI